MLRTWAAKVAGAEGKTVDQVLRENGILGFRAQRSIYENEMTFSFYGRHVASKEEQED